jgi:hypothetical protein
MLKTSTVQMARIAKSVMRNNNLRVGGDITGLHSLIFARAMYPKQLTAALRSVGFRTADVNFCQADEELCEGNIGLPRIDMPVLDNKPGLAGPGIGYLDDVTNLLANGMLDIHHIPKLNQATPSYLRSGQGRRENKVKVQHKKVDVKDLKATQNQLWLGKAIEMALNNWGLDEFLVTSKDNYVIDGHHRWAALLLISQYTREQLANLLPLALKNETHEVQFLFEEYKKQPSLPGKKHILANCAEFDLGYERLLAVMNAYTDAKNINRKP